MRCAEHPSVYRVCSIAVLDTDTLFARPLPPRPRGGAATRLLPTNRLPIVALTDALAASLPPSACGLDEAVDRTADCIPPPQSAPQPAGLWGARPRRHGRREHLPWPLWLVWSGSWMAASSVQLCIGTFDRLQCPPTDA